MFKFTNDLKKKVGFGNWNNDLKMSFCAYQDSDGNYLGPEDIIFMDEKTYEARSNLRTWDEAEEDYEELTVYSEGVELIYDECGNFPIALRTEEGKSAYLKVSKKTGEILPIHAGCCPVLSIIFVGPSRAAKTVAVLQFSDSLYHDMIVKHTKCSVWDDLPSNAPSRIKYEEKREKFHRHILPAPTLKNETILPYCFFVEYGDGKRILLKLEDIDGEQCTNIQWESRIFHNNFYVLTIGADEIISGNENQYSKMVNQLLPRLKVLRRENDYEVMVMITKCDCLDKSNVHLRGAFENSIELNQGKWEQTTHAGGFNYEVFNHRSNCIQSFIKDEAPNFYNKLTNVVPKQNLTFCMIASVGEECKDDNTFENYRPFCIDEPIVSILAKAGVYPVAVKGEKPKEKPVESYELPKRKTSSTIGRVLNLMNYEYEEEVDDDEYSY